MIYYSINNCITNKTEYFVPDEETKFSNPHLTCFVGDRLAAETKIAQYKDEFLIQESYRFSICKEIVKGNDTVWTAALENDVEDHVYHVFDSMNGIHIPCPSFSAALAKSESLKNEFFGLFDWGVTEISTLPNEPLPTRTIPVEVM